MSLDFRDIKKAAEAQGWRIVETKKGLQFIPSDPTREIVQWHGTPSDWRAIRNFLARLRKQGFEYPPRKGARE